MQYQEFQDRGQAGDLLAQELASQEHRENPVVFGIARGGVPVADRVARAFDAPLDAVLVQKIGVPSNPELALGAVTNTGAMVTNEWVVRSTGLSSAEVNARADQAIADVRQQATEIHGESEPVSPEGRTVILVDDGLATGASMSAAVRAMRQSGAETVVVGVPVASNEAIERVDSAADELVSLMTPSNFDAVAQWYVNFDQTSNAEVRRAIERRR